MRQSPWTFLVIFCAAQAAAALLPMAAAMAGITMSRDTLIVLTVVAANLLTIAATAAMRPPWLTCRTLLGGMPQPATARYIIAAPGLIVAVNIVQELLLPWLPDLVDPGQLEPILHSAAGLTALCVLAPVAEELVFRAGVQGALQHKAQPATTAPSRTPATAAPASIPATAAPSECCVASGSAASTTPASTTPASTPPASPPATTRLRLRPVVAASALFALAHANPAQMPAAFVIGMFLGAAYQRTGHLTAPIATHMLNNTMAAALALAFPQAQTITALIGGTIPAAIVATASAAWAYAWVRPRT